MQTHVKSYTVPPLRASNEAVSLLACVDFISMERPQSASVFALPSSATVLPRKMTLCSFRRDLKNVFVSCSLTRSDFPGRLSSSASSGKWSRHVTLLVPSAVMSLLTTLFFCLQWSSVIKTEWVIKACFIPSLQLQCEKDPLLNESHGATANEYEEIRLINARKKNIQTKFWRQAGKREFERSFQ